MNEHSYVKAVHKALSPEVFKWKIHDTYAGGVPDAFYSGPKAFIWAEYKYIKKLPVQGTSILKNTVSPLQKSWLNRAVDHGQRVMVIYGYEDKALVLENKEWNAAALTKDQFIKKCISRKEFIKRLETICLDVPGLPPD